MITQRQHVASLVAVFLALAIGVVVGGETLHATVVHDLRRQEAEAVAAAGLAVAAGRADRVARADSEAFTAAAAPRLLSGRLAGLPVLLVSLPGTSSGDLTRVAAALRAAGGTVAGDLRLGATAVDPDAGALLTDVTARLTGGRGGASAPAGAALAGFADALVAATTTGPGGDLDPGRVLATSRAAALLDVGSGSSARARAALLVTGGPAAAAGTGSARAQAGLVVARALRDRGLPVTVVGSGAAALAGGPLAAVRADAPLRAAVSTADGLELSEGPVVAVLALAERVAGRSEKRDRGGHYGTGPGATAPLPPA